MGSALRKVKKNLFSELTWCMHNNIVVRAAIVNRKDEEVIQEDFVYPEFPLDYCGCAVSGENRFYKGYPICTEIRELLQYYENGKYQRTPSVLMCSDSSD